MSNEAIKAADGLGAAIHARNAQMVADLYDDSIVVWHGSTRQGMGKDQNVGLLRDIFELTSAMEYRNIRRYPIDGGVVQQHVLCGAFADGTPLPELEACLIIMVRDGRITKIDEYFDAAQFGEVWKRLEEYHAAKAG